MLLTLFYKYSTRLDVPMKFIKHNMTITLTLLALYLLLVFMQIIANNQMNETELKYKRFEKLNLQSETDKNKTDLYEKSYI